MPHLVIQNGKVATNSDGTIFMATQQQLEDCCCGDACAALRMAIYERQRFGGTISYINLDGTYTLQQYVDWANGLLINSNNTGIGEIRWVSGDWTDPSALPPIYPKGARYALEDVEDCAELLALVVTDLHTLVSIPTSTGGCDFHLGEASGADPHSYSVAYYNYLANWPINDTIFSPIHVYTAGWGEWGNYIEGSADYPSGISFWNLFSTPYRNVQMRHFVLAIKPSPAPDPTYFHAHGTPVIENQYALIGTSTVEEGDESNCFTYDNPEYYDGYPGAPATVPGSPSFMGEGLGWMAEGECVLIIPEFLY